MPLDDVPVPSAEAPAEWRLPPVDWKARYEQLRGKADPASMESVAARWSAYLARRPRPAAAIRAQDVQVMLALAALQ